MLIGHSLDADAMVEKPLECFPRRFATRGRTFNPDAVISGSHVWQGKWSQERAAAYGIEVVDLEQRYRQRSLLQCSVLPQAVAEAIHFFASERASRSTGNVLNADARNATAFPR